jgi:DNA repair exonuclease SbcCD ATPase subunit
MSDAASSVVEPVKKVAFMSRPYSKEERIQKEEDELKELIKEQKTGNEETEDDTANLGAEEKTFKKRYSDLRRHQQKQAEDLRTEIDNLKSQLDSATKKEFKLPKTDDDIASWAEQYPDVAAIVETIAMKKASERSLEIEAQVSELNSERLQMSKERAENELYVFHPDFDSIRDSDSFHDWAEEQPTWIQKALYENDDDAKSAARAIDLYKADMGTSKKNTGNKEKDAARSVKTKGERNRPATTTEAGAFKESVVEKMTPQEYEKNSDAIMESIRGGSFIYDVSGSAR